MDRSVNPYVRWYSIAVWFGIVANLAFCLTAWFAPERVLKLLKLNQTKNTMWLRNVGMLLVNLSIFNAGAALAPLRYPLNSWLVPIARLIAAFFFFQVALKDLRGSTERPKSFLALLIFDFSMGVICSLLLYLGNVGLPGGKRTESGARRE
jgi:hypothetical protein